MLLFFHPLLFPPLLPVILFSPSVSPRSAPLLPRRWGRGWHRGRKASFLFWLRHALPDRLLEGPVCLCSSHGLHEWLGVFHHLYHYNRPAHGRHRRPGISLRLHYWPKGLGHCCGFCGTRHLSPRWVQEKQKELFLKSTCHFQYTNFYYIQIWALKLCSLFVMSFDGYVVHIFVMKIVTSWAPTVNMLCHQDCWSYLLQNDIFHPDRNNMSPKTLTASAFSAIKGPICGTNKIYIYNFSKTTKPGSQKSLSRFVGNVVSIFENINCYSTRI